jgi:prepilin-type processing-associated H-X9-DG protein
MYAGDYDETLPPSIAGTPTGALVSTYELLAPYTRNDDIEICPSDRQGAIDLTTYGLGRYSYGWNKKLFAYRLPAYIPGPPQSPIIGLAQVPYPSETTTFFDGQQDGQAVLTAHRHNEGANVGFLDGHAKWHGAASPPRGCTANNYHFIPG